MKLIFSLLILNVFLKFENADLEPFVVQPINNKICIIILKSPFCHECMETIENSIKNIKERNFKYYILPYSKVSIIERKQMIDFLSKQFNPDNFIFLHTKSDFDMFCKNYKILNFPSIILQEDTLIQIIPYEKIFKDYYQSKSMTDSIFVSFNKN